MRRLAVVFSLLMALMTGCGPEKEYVVALRGYTDEQVTLMERSIANQDPKPTLTKVDSGLPERRIKVRAILSQTELETALNKMSKELGLSGQIVNEGDVTALVNNESKPATQAKATRAVPRQEFQVILIGFEADKLPLLEIQLKEMLGFATLNPLPPAPGRVVYLLAAHATPSEVRWELERLVKELGVEAAVDLAGYHYTLTRVKESFQPRGISIVPLLTERLIVYYQELSAPAAYAVRLLNFSPDEAQRIENYFGILAGYAQHRPRRQNPRDQEYLLTIDTPADELGRKLRKILWEEGLSGKVERGDGFLP